MNGAGVQIQAVLLDLGNVLAFHDDQMVLGRFAARAGRTVDDIAAGFSPVWADIGTGRLQGEPLRRSVCDRIGVDLDESEFAAIWSCHFTIHEAILPLVEALVLRTRVLLLSNTNARHFDHLRPRLPVLDRFHDIVLSHEVGISKPDRGIYDEAVRRAGVPSGACVFFDDVARNLDAARALGIHGRLFTDAPTFAADLQVLGLR